VKPLAQPCSRRPFFSRPLKAKDCTRLLWTYLRRRYYLERRFGPYDVMRRYEEATAPLGMGLDLPPGAAPLARERRPCGALA
jgi:hypothetical protein